MTANKTLLQMKYARVISLFSKMADITKSKALEFFYHSDVYQFVKDGISDMHCMSDEYLAEDLLREYQNNRSNQ